MKVITKDNVIFSFSSNHQPCAEVEDGEVFWVETWDCYYDQIKSEQDLRSTIDVAKQNPGTGPIFVKGADPGDCLEVQILEIETGDVGIMTNAPGLGLLGEYVQRDRTRIVPISNGNIHFSAGITLPVNRMVGLIGTTPQGMEVSTRVPGDHGGNLDTIQLGCFSRIYLPVYVPGALLALGDVHASMGDGELSGTGVETSGRILIKVQVHKNGQVKRPIIETQEELVMLGSGNSLMGAVLDATWDAVQYIQTNLGLSFEDAYCLLSASCNAGISQVVNPLVTAKVVVPKRIFGNSLVS